MSGGGKAPATISTTEPRIGTLRVQTSMYGLAQPMVWGQTRVTGNLLWFGNFQAIATTTTTTSGGGGGKGGGGGGGVTQSDTKYSYKAAAMLGIARGPILGIGGVWRGKSYFFGGTVDAATLSRSHTLQIPTGVSTLTVPFDGAFGTTISAAYIEPAPAYDVPINMGPL